MIQVWEGANKVGEYTFNGAGQRIKKVAGGATKIFHYDLLGHIIGETDQNGQMLTEYVYLGDQLLTMIKPGEQAYYFHNDHLGTPRVLTDATQTVAWKAAYTPFGEAVTSIATVQNPFRFPGQYYDSETGLHYNYFRYYNPPIGRYLTPDPIGLEGGINLFAYVDSVGKPLVETNLYTYTGNNPINWVDPIGLAPQIYGQFRGQASAHVGIAGLSVSAGGAVSTGGQICGYVTVCMRLGPGAYAGAGFGPGAGIVRGNTSGLRGLSVGLGGDVGWGPSAGGQVLVGVGSEGITSGGVARGIYGGGSGLSFGIDICWTEMKCTKDSNACRK